MGLDMEFYRNHSLLPQDLPECYEIPVSEVIYQFLDLFYDAFLYLYFLQIILVLYMYYTVGGGKYWKLLVISSYFGLFGAVTEHICSAYVNASKNYNTYYSENWIHAFVRNDCIKNRYMFVCYVISELGWIVSEYSVAFLNLIKLNALSQSKSTKYINYIISLLFVVFIGTRFYIGYTRYQAQAIYNSNIWQIHGYAFSVTAVADLILSIRIFMELYKSAKKFYEKNSNSFSIIQCFMKSSLFVIFIVDMVGVIVSCLSIFGERYHMNLVVRPFHALKSNVALILAVDAVVFKLRASQGLTTSAAKSTEASNKGIGNGTHVHTFNSSFNGGNDFEKKNNSSKFNNTSFNTTFKSSNTYNNIESQAAAYDLLNKVNKNVNVNDGSGMNNINTMMMSPNQFSNNGSKFDPNNDLAPLSGTTLTDNGNTDIGMGNPDYNEVYTKKYTTTNFSEVQGIPTSPTMYTYGNYDVNSPTSKISGISGIGNIGVGGLKYKTTGGSYTNLGNGMNNINVSSSRKNVGKMGKSYSNPYLN